MSTRIHQVSACPIKTNLGFSFNPTKFSRMGPWSCNPSKDEELLILRLKRTEAIFERDPSRWTGLIGEIYGGLTNNKFDIGVKVIIKSNPYALTDYYDSYEGFITECVIEKLGRGVWTKVILPPITSLDIGCHCIE